MINLNLIVDNSIIICSNKNIDFLTIHLSKINPRLHVKYLTKEELLTGLDYDYDYKALEYLHIKHNLSYDIAEEILNNLHFLNNFKLSEEEMNDYKYEHIKELLAYYHELKDNYLIFNPLFKELFNNHPVFIFGYDDEIKEIELLLNNNNIKYNKLEYDNNDYNHELRIFPSASREFDNVVYKIKELIDKGISLNHIYLYDLPTEYHSILNKYEHYSDLIIESLTKINLYNSPIYLRFRSLIKDKKTDEAKKYIMDETIKDEFNVVGAIISIYNDIADLNLDGDNYINLFDYLAKRKNLSSNKYLERIRYIDSLSLLNDDDYVFILGFNQENYPIIYNDNDFLSNNDRKILGLSTSIDKKLGMEKSLISFIKHNKNVYLSCKLKEAGVNYSLSSLIGTINVDSKYKDNKRINDILKRIDKEGYKEAHKNSNEYIRLSLNETIQVDLIDDENINRSSETLSKIEVAGYKDVKENYGIDSEYVDTYSDDEISYKKFDHKFKGLNNYNEPKVTLSYSSIEQYNKCPFSYYVRNVLKVVDNEDSFSTLLGTLFHEVLAINATKRDLNNFNEDAVYNEVDKLYSTEKERTLARALVPQLFKVLKMNSEFLNNTSFDSIEVEFNKKYPFDENTIVVGTIDKVMINEDKKEFIIIDYKTYNLEYEKEKNPYGLSLQLPIYSYLMNIEKKDYKVVGIYIQNILLGKDKIDLGSAYKLDGYTIYDMNVLVELDHNYDHKSKYIKNVDLTINGDVAAKSVDKLVDDNFFDDIQTIADKEINKASINIRKGNFDIKPIVFNNKYDKAYCSLCDCQDLCFREFSDYHNVNLKGDQSNE